MKSIMIRTRGTKELILNKRRDIRNMIVKKMNLKSLVARSNMKMMKSIKLRVMKQTKVIV